LTKNYAVIPVKQFEESKQRLSGVLSIKERADLTFHLLSNMLGQLQASNVDTIILVATNDAEVEKLVPEFSKLAVVEETVHNGGVNSAMRDGLGLVSATSKVLLLPSDLPLITGAAIDRALELLDANDVIINPSDRKDGTNLLGFWASKIIDLHYDDNSVSKHLAEIEKRKLKFAFIEWKEFLTDVDDPEDLRYLMKVNGVNRFSELMEKLELP
jgi:2-phospho-L-lactate guanylyltransferase